MKALAGSLLFFYLLVTILWVANSPYLFSIWGLIIWSISIALGFFVFKQIKEPIILKKLMLYSSSVMVFFVLVTVFIELIVSSMP